MRTCTTPFAITPTRRLAGESQSAATASGISDVQQSLKHHLKTRDMRLTVPSRDRLVSVTFVSTRSLLVDTITRHHLLRRTGACLPFLEMIGTQLSFTQLLASPLSGEERVEARLTTDEATIHTAALGLGESFAYIRSAYNAQLLAQGDILDPFPLKVDRVLYNQHQPFSSMVSASLQALLEVDKDTAQERAQKHDTAPPFSLALQLLLRPPVVTSDVEDVEWCQPTLENVAQFFSSNSTLHAYNYYRRSDGTPSAVWLHAELVKSVLADAGLLTSRGEPTHACALNDAAPHDEGVVKAIEARWASLKHTLLAAVPASFGVQLTPLAAGPEVEWRLWSLQRALVLASAASRHSVTPNPLTSLLHEAQSTHTLCQTVLSLVTGDVEGASAVAQAARQYTRDPAAVARGVEPLRSELGIDGVRVALDAEAVTRVPLDFFCRCSKANMLSSFVSIPEAAFREVSTQDAFQCATCGKWHVVTTEDWSNVTAARASTPQSSA